MRVLAAIAGLGATAHGLHHGERRAGSWDWGAAVTGVAEESVCGGGSESHGGECGGSGGSGGCIGDGCGWCIKVKCSDGMRSNRWCACVVVAVVVGVVVGV
jgi:hypothetical protein